MTVRCMPKLLLIAFVGFLTWLTSFDARAQNPTFNGGNGTLRLREAPLPSVVTVGEPVVTKLEPLAFKGIKIGASSVADVARAWGPPQQSHVQETIAQQTFSVEPYDRIEATFYRNVILSATIVLRSSLPLEEIAEQLQLSQIESVTLRELGGKVSGRLYPERGVSLLYANVAEHTVQQIILDSLEAPPFAQRGERHLSRQPTRALQDAQYALQVDERNGRAWRLRAKALLRLDRAADALAAAEQACTHDANHPESRLVKARAWAAAGKRADALALVQQVVQETAEQPSWKGQALVCQGDVLVQGSPEDAQRALTVYQQAIATAEPGRQDELYETRRLAVETLIAAHVGAGDAISVANWQNKSLAVSRWLEQAVQITQESFGQDPEAIADYAFEIGTHAIALSVRLNGELDVRSWADDCRALADQRLVGVRNTADRLRIIRSLVVSFEQVAQSAQKRKDIDVALDYTQRAIGIWREVASQQPLDPTDQELLGLLYFRVGCCQAIGKQDHAQAVLSFDQARPHLELSSERAPPRDPARLGETLVSMAVSYWASGQQQSAIDLTENGAKWMQQAVDQGRLDRSALSVPYANLAQMHEHRGEAKQAESFQELAGRASGKTLR